MFAIPRAAADVMPPGGNYKRLDRKFLEFDVSAFDPYCEHRRAIATGDTLESIARTVYGDATQAKEIAAANPKLDASHWLVGERIVLPPKESPPQDASETLAWEFWIYCNLSGYMPLQRVYPGESLEVEGKFPELVAVPVAHHDDFVKLIADPEAASVPPELLIDRTPWALRAKDFYVDSTASRSSSAVEGTTKIRITELVATTNTPGRFAVEETDVVYRDRTGAVVRAGFELLFSWRGIPLALIVLVGVVGLRRLRRSRAAAALLGIGLALGVAAPTASADIIPNGLKCVNARLVLRADRFDDYCEHHHKIAKGDTFEAIARAAYGDAAHSKDVAAANPKLEATRLPIGADVLLPPKLAPPKDSKETLAWAFWAASGRFSYVSLRRIWPDEIDYYNGLIAVPADKVAEFEKLLAAANRDEAPAGSTWLNEILKRTPWAIPASGLLFDNYVDEKSPADESLTTFRIAELAAGPDPPARFVVKKDSVEYRDRKGNVVKAGFDLLLTWRGIPLGLIVLIGAVGLQRLRRRSSVPSSPGAI